MQGVNSSGQLEEINTKEVAQRITAELKRYSIPQAIFAQRVLCRSQGTLSDLLRNPKPWSKLKSGRETFRRMWKWLQEPEFQRMSALRLAGKRTTNRGHAAGLLCFVRPDNRRNSKLNSKLFYILLALFWCFLVALFSLCAHIDEWNLFRITRVMITIIDQ